MRIGVDLLPLQSPGSRSRGVGRLATELIRNISHRLREDELVLLRHGAFPWPKALDREMYDVLTIDTPERTDRHGVHRALQNLVNRNDAHLDVYLNLNPFEPCPGHDLPRRPIRGPKLIAYVHDLIPLEEQERYLANPADAAWFRTRCRTIRSYDGLITNSEATRRACLEQLGVKSSHVTAVGAGVDLQVFRPARSENEEIEDIQRVDALGIRSPFFLHLGGKDERKNLWGLIEGHARSEGAAEAGACLVVAGDYDEVLRSQAEGWARKVRLNTPILWTGRISDRTLVALYRRCLGFVLISKAEGFGLPLVEAMACGAPVIAADESAQAEVVGNAARVVPLEQPDRLAEELTRLVNDGDLRDRMRAAGINRARLFSWELVADRTEEAIRNVVNRGMGLARSRGKRSGIDSKKGRVAMVSPLPGKGTGIADYTASLVDALSISYAIDLYHDSDHVPESYYRDGRFAYHDYRMFKRINSESAYLCNIYQMGNSWYHKFLYSLALNHPGVVVLHDLHLAGYHWWFGSLLESPKDYFRNELERDAPAGSTEWIPLLERWKNESGGLQGAAARRGAFLHRRLLERAKRVVVHSQWALNALADRHPDLAERFVHIPLGAVTMERDEQQIQGVRRGLGLGEATVLIGCFGILTRNKMDEELIEAFARVLSDRPDMMLIFVGKDWENGSAMRLAERMGVGDRIRFLGRVERRDYESLVCAVDVAVSLRRPPTFGETSASLLDCLRAGRPTIINDAGTLGEIPDEVVVKLRWEREGVSGLARALSELAGDEQKRKELGRRARDHVASRHSWSLVSCLYSRVIEEESERTARAKSGRVA